MRIIRIRIIKKKLLVTRDYKKIYVVLKRGVIHLYI